MKVKEVEELLSGLAREVRIVGERRVFATVGHERFREVLEALRRKGVQHLSTISGVDRGTHISVVYHFGCRPCLLSVRVDLPPDRPEISTLTDLFPGAEIYERDLMEMLGVKVLEHPDPRRFFLPDDWPEGVYPLRKEAKQG